MRSHSILLSLLPSLAAAITPPNVGGMKLMWSDDFEGPAGSSPDTNTWNIMTDIDTNNEVETYTVGNSNLQISGGGTVQFVPRKSATGHWTSGRIETKESWTPTPGKVMMVSANILIGDNAAANKQGIWPAFWLLGEAVRHGTEWPGCGEIDIFEQVNGQTEAHGTLHCGTESGGPCNETTGKSGTVAIPTSGFHTWSAKIDLTSSDWRAQTISFQLDGATFYSVSGATINDQAVWSTLAHSPMYMILNVAVGGNWPGAPNDATLDGYGAMMEVQWAAVYTS
ncbi:glycoside hydrolase family 16 protein [Xylariaceae sp. FL1272]|nr:glycoside hydrolase family 16 protein [Xylariaceae sp. FL1272]